MALSELDHTAVQTWEDFRSYVEHIIPDRAISPTTPIAEATDRLGGQLIALHLRTLLAPLPTGLLDSIDTFGEAYEWLRVAQDRAATDDRDAPLRSRREGDLLSGPNVHLRPISFADIGALYSAAIDPRWSYRWRFRGHTPSVTAFFEDLQRSAFLQYIVEDNSSPGPIALLAAYEPHPPLHVHIAFTRLSPRKTSLNSELVEGVTLFLEELLITRNFGKAYGEIPGFNWELFASGDGLLFHTEALLAPIVHGVG